MFLKYFHIPEDHRHKSPNGKFAACLRVLFSVRKYVLGKYLRNFPITTEDAIKLTAA